MLLKNGIDVSEFQYIDSWEDIKKNIDFVILRAGFGYSTLDSNFEYNVSKVNKLAIPYGAYWFSYAKDVRSAEMEAEYFCATMKRYKKPDLPIYWDFEYDSERYCQKFGITVTKKLFNDMMLAFCRKVKEWGFKPGIYTNPDYLNRLADKSIIEKEGISLWLASWKDDSEYSNPPIKCDIWQYASDGRIPGIYDEVDLDFCYLDTEQKPEKSMNEKIDDITNKYNSICKDIMRGKYGSGTERKAALGKYYDIAQSIINELFGVM